MTLLNRRRFMTISAAAAFATPARAEPVVWSGAGMGGALSIRLEGASAAQAVRLQGRITAEVERIEAEFSLYRDSALRRLNRDGRLSYPTQVFHDLCALISKMHDATGGRFDPTVQVLWEAALAGSSLVGTEALIGWRKVEIGPEEIRLPQGMKLTFNGIAQGFAADRIATLLRAEGLHHVLIDLGEIATLGPRLDGRAWRAEVQDPAGGTLAQVSLDGRALATSSPMATRLPDGRGHIRHPAGGDAIWGTVAVSAPSAAVADGLSTAFCLMDRPEMASALQAFPRTRCEALRREAVPSAKAERAIDQPATR